MVWCFFNVTNQEISKERKNTAQLNSVIFQSSDWSKTEQERVSCIKSDGTSSQHEEGELCCLLKTRQLEAVRLLVYSPVVCALIPRNTQRIVIIKQGV